MKKKKKEPVISKKKIKRMKRSDGLKMKLVDTYTMERVVAGSASRYPKRIALRTYAEEGSELTYSELKRKSDAVSLYFLEQGFVKGDRIALIGESCPNWMLAYFGLTGIGLTAVPVLPEFSPKEILHILQDGGVKAVVVNARHVEKILPFIRKKPEFLIRLEDLFHIPMPISGELKDRNQCLNAPGRDITRRKVDAKARQLLSEHRPKEEDPASLIYTSGTTGMSKAVMLTHRNLVWNADISSDVYFKVKPGYKALSILPVSHVYEFTIGQVLALLCGCEIVYLGRPPAPSSLLPALKEVRPHIIMTVPLLIEKIYRSSVLPTLKANPKLQRYLRFGITRRFIFRIIGRKLIVTMGGRVRFFGIGGAPLDREVEAFLAEAKFPYALGYGLTETSPLISGGKPKNHTVGVIGKIVEHLEVRLEEKDPATGIGEIAVKGPSVMQGYWNNPALNEEAFTPDGFFKTGDLGFIDKKGRLAIKGRTKTMILGSGGENIYPELIEAVINNQDFVTESLVIPEGGALVALIKLDIEAFAEKMALSVNEAKSEAARYLNKLREEVNKELNVFSRLSKVHLQEDAFERTPTQKIKRFLYLRKKDESSDA